MAGWTNTYEQAILNHILRGTSMPGLSTNLYVALSTSTPGDDGSNFTEPSGNGYARVEAVRSSSSPFGAASGAAPAESTTTAAITFPAATGSWGTLTHWGLFTASSGGTLVAFGALTSSEAVGNGDIASFPIGDLTLAEGDPGDF